MRSSATEPPTNGALPSPDRPSARPATRPATQTISLGEALPRVGHAFAVARGAPGDSPGTDASGGWSLLPWPADSTQGRGHAEAAAILPAAALENLGDPAFCAAHGLRFPYLAGAMAHGISSVEMVIAMGRAGMLGIFGAAGLPPSEVEAAIDALEAARAEGDFPYGMNLIHSPGEPALEAAVVDLYLHRGVRLVSASAYLALTREVVRYRLKGLHLSAQGEVIAPNRIIAKVSREEVARAFLSPAPEALVAELLAAGQITQTEASLAGRIPVAQDLTVEADSGGHTDNRPLITLMPTLIALRDRLQATHGYATPLRIGAAGGIATPASAAAAFAMGAAYIVVGSVHQACLESGTSDLVRRLLAETRQADVCMAPAADMFEMGVKLQVLKRGTLFAARAGRLYELYRAHESLESLSAKDRDDLEKKLFRASLDEVWEHTRTFFAARDPSQLERAARDPKHRMALVFRWYLGSSSFWAKQGLAKRQVDLQIWCGPAMGAFNAWTRGSFLEGPKRREVVCVALNLLHGAALLFRVNALAHQGVRVPAAQIDARPRTLAEIEELLQ